MLWFKALATLTLATLATAGPIIEGDCLNKASGLSKLPKKLSDKSAISCLGQPLQQHNAERYWGTQFSKNASVVVYPGTTKDVSHTVKALADAHKPFTFAGGAHSQVNASSSYGTVLDLSWMNKSRVIHDFKVYSGRRSSERMTVIEYEGGANWGQVLKTTNGTGWTAIGARVANVGVGGFSLGGGISFLGNAYGVATDRLVQLEFVLPCGKIIIATKHNEYSDLFWASQGGGGQFGIVTRFWQKAVPEPKESTLGLYYIDDDDFERVQKQTVDFFNENEDPFSLIYYSFGYLPSTIQGTAVDDYAKRTLLFTVHCNHPDNPEQPNNKEAFAKLLDGINTTNSVVTTTPHYSDLTFIGVPAFPYGYRRGFYGGQTSKIDVSYIKNLTSTFYGYLDDVLDRGEEPLSSSFILQYVFPGLNGNLPKSDADTAWPHAKVGHQTLFAPAWKDAKNDGLALAATEALDQITWDRQDELGEFIGDYPNYISPQVDAHRVWGDNVDRLLKVKQKYDPDCRIREGKVFASSGCLAGGWATV